MLKNQPLKSRIIAVRDEFSSCPHPEIIIKRLKFRGVIKEDDAIQLSRSSSDREKWQNLLSILEASSHPEPFLMMYLALKSDSNYKDIIFKINSLQMQPASCRRPSMLPPLTTEIKGKLKRKLNILLVGETGTGKSTWINAFANYCMFPSFDVAIKKFGCFPVRMLMPVTDPTTNAIRVIGTHENMSGDANEIGYSQTTLPQKYSFHHEIFGTITLIDTPGFLDVTNPVSPQIEDDRGATTRWPGSNLADKQHVENTMQLLTSIKKLDAIFVLLKATDNKLNVNFQYTLGEIFRHLHARAAHNVVFILTCSASVRYQASKVQPLLEKFIRDNKLEIPIPPAIFCFENDTVQFIIEEYNRIQHDEYDQRDAAIKWERSVKATQQVLNHVYSLTPHDLVDTLNIYNAANVNDILSEMVLMTADCIFKNEQEIDARHKQLLMLSEESDKYGEFDLNKLIHVKERVVVVESLPHVNVVCQSEKCTRVVGDQIIPQKCCEKCSSTFLYFCHKIDVRGKCRICNCSKIQHIWTSQEVKFILRDKPDREHMERVKKIIEMKDKNFQLLAAFEEMESCLKEARIEKEMIMRICAKLCIFQQMNSMMGSSVSDSSYAADNDPLLVRLEREINAFSSALASSRVAELSNIKIEYEQFLLRAKKRLHDYPADLNDILESLFELPIQGDRLRQAVEANMAAQKRALRMLKSHRESVELPANCIVSNIDPIPSHSS